ncbi:protein fuzzy homolog [Coturnix japonica]|uniref:protein fuzzy homolog n=1 Tax=Coturnix japonica TaxID=93934 RepID=UPI000776B043|nr:protein fuzzy homolog [Coturnix japonica]
MSEAELGAMLDRIYGAMVLVVGAEELSQQHGPERLKRELRRCFPLLDALIGGDVTLSRPLPATPRPEMEVLLQSLCSAARSGPSCIRVLGVGGPPLVSTPQWRALPHTDAAILVSLLTSGSAHSAKDLPVFLPTGSPAVPLRLLLLPLLGGLWLLMLCGPQPSLQCAATQLVPHFLGPAVDQLRSWARPTTAPLPHSVMAYLLIDRLHCTTHSGLGPGGSKNSALPPRRYGAALWRMKELLVERYCPEGGGGEAPWPNIGIPGRPWWQQPTRTGHQRGRTSSY